MKTSLVGGGSGSSSGSQYKRNLFPVFEQFISLSIIQQGSVHDRVHKKLSKCVPQIWGAANLHTITCGMTTKSKSCAEEALLTIPFSTAEARKDQKRTIIGITDFVSKNIMKLFLTLALIVQVASIHASESTGFLRSAEVSICEK